MKFEPGPDFDKPLFSGRKILLAGCIAVLAIMAVSTIEITRSLKKTSAKSDQMIASFRERTEILEELRSAMILRGTMHRYRLAESAGQQSSDSPAEILASRQQTEQLLEQFETLARRDSDSDTLNKLAALRTAFDAYWDSMPAEPAIGSSARARGSTIHYSLLLAPLRNEISRVSGDITDLNDRQLDIAEAKIHSEQNRLQAKLGLDSIVKICIIFTLFLAISLRIKKTQRFAEFQYRRVVQARAELRKLAACLENVQEEERRNLSRELHDEVGQAMATILLELGRFNSEMFDEAEARERIAAIKTQIESAMRSVRDLALLLRPSMLDDLGLVPALKWQGREVERRTGLSIRVEAEDSSDALPDPYRTCIYRVVQEALHNVVKHAGANAVTVRFRTMEDHLDLRIEDNGQGFDPATDKGLGILGMEERVARLGGHVEVLSNRRDSTSINVLLPSPM